jgi:hypothetical protein
LFPEHLTQATCFENCFEINSDIKNDGVPKDSKTTLPETKSLGFGYLRITTNALYVFIYGLNDALNSTDFALYSVELQGDNIHVKIPSDVTP